jgi:hypothetical protein
MPLFSKTIESAVDIDATFDSVWNTVANLPGYHEWNRATRFAVPAVVGKLQTMRVKLGPLWLAVPVLIQHCDAQQGLRWVGGIPGLITGSHYFRVEKTGENHVRLVQGEDFTGLLVPVLLPLLGGVLATLYAGINADTKASVARKAN